MAQRKIVRADLRRSYPLHLEIGFVLAVGILVLAFRSDWNPKATFIIDIPDEVTITIDEITPTDPLEKPPAPPRPAVPVAVPDDQLPEDDPLILDPIDLELVPPAGPPAVAPSKEPDVEAEIFVVVEQQPTPIGGMTAIYKHITYPDMARRAGVEGMVIVQFVVDEQGDVSEAKVLKGVGAGLDEAAVEAVKKVKFNPGKQRGKAVRVRMSLPITFKLK